MSNTTFVVALRLFGIWLILNWGFSLLGYVLNPQSLSIPHILVASVIWATWLLFGVALLTKPVAFGQLLVPGGVRGGGRTPWSIEDFQTVAFKLIGLWFVASAIGSERFWDAVLFPFSAESAHTGIVDLSGVAALVCKIAVGLLLLISAEWLVEKIGVVRRTRD